MRWIFGILILAGLVAFSSFSIALADPPPCDDSSGATVCFEGPIPRESTVVLADCGAFQVLDAFRGELSATLFFDVEGNLERAILNFAGTDTYINSVTGTAFTQPFRNLTFIELDEGTTAIVGVILHLTIPGGGAAFLDIGRVAIDAAGSVAFEAGPLQFGAVDFAGLCAALL